jgi:hypothetical protein
MNFKISPRIKAGSDEGDRNVNLFSNILLPPTYKVEDDGNCGLVFTPFE